MIDQEHMLSIFRSTEALLDGHFMLTSGRHSATYFQCAKVLQHPEYLTAFSVILADEFEPLDPDVVMSPAIGGIVLGTEVGTQLGCRTMYAERKEGKMVIRRGFELSKGERVLVIEDVITTGGSVKEVMDLVTDMEAEVIGVGVLVDRSNGTASLHENQFSIVELDAVSYGDDEVPNELAAIPIQKPGSRHLK